MEKERKKKKNKKMDSFLMSFVFVVDEQIDTILRPVLLFLCVCRDGGGVIPCLYVVCVLRFMLPLRVSS